MIQLALSLLLSASMLLQAVTGNPGASPELKQQANQVATTAIAYAYGVLGAGSVSLQDGTGGEITLTLPSMVVEAVNPVMAEKLAFTVQPVLTKLSTSTGQGIYNDANYSLTFETNVPATAVYSAFNSNFVEQTATTTFDLRFSNTWGMQVPFEVNITDSVNSLKYQGQLKP